MATTARTQSDLGVILFATILALSALYAPQPLLPVIAAQFSVSLEAAAALTTVTFIPLSIAPLVYGYLLEKTPPLRLLRIAVLLLALSEIAFYFAPTFAALLGLRLFQGLLIPAMLTALMTRLSLTTPAAALPRVMAWYVSATILGGFLGRACSGIIASAMGWRATFLLLAASLLVCFVLLRRLPAEAPLTGARPTAGGVLEILSRPLYRRVYLLVFCLFLVFAAIMNFIPFRLTEISAQASEWRIGLMYSGYLMGLLTALGAVALGRRLGGAVPAMRLGLLVFALALLGLAAPRVEALFLVMFLFCGAMFLVHATASGFINRQAADRKGIVNGLYVSFYYAGGAIGSFVPGFIYRRYDWTAVLLFLLVFALLALVAAWRLHSGKIAADRLIT
jgi:MFS transporter, YNFM family, putative membrane transport protein